MIGAGLAALIALAPPVGDGLADPRDAVRSSGPPTASRSSAMPHYFLANRGQAHPRARYYLEAGARSAYFTQRGFTLTVPRRRDRWALELRHVGARGGAGPSGRGRTPAVVSYFRGRRAIRAPTFSSVVYRDAWPGIDVVYSGRGTELKSSFVVKPGASPESIRLAWRGSSGLALDRRGRLEIRTPAGTITDGRPLTYQLRGRRRVPVSSSYRLRGRTSYGFSVGRYDRTKPLVIDPAVFVYAGFIGGLNDDAANNVAVDARGNLYVTGGTQSSAATFPERTGPDRSHNGAPDAFVAKVDPSGSRLIYAGYIGGSSEDTGIGIAVDRRGNAYVSGSTASSERTFPVTRSFDRTYGGGPFDAFVAKVDPTGRRLLYAGYIGGSGVTPPAAPNEQANGVAVDAAGNAYVAGFTASSQAAGFPATAGSFDPTHNGFVDTFVAKVDPAGARLRYAGYIGGTLVDPGTGITIDGRGNAYVNGFTSSDQTTFPDGDGFGTVPGPDQTYNGGPEHPRPGDAYVAKVSAAGDRLLYAGYIGGSGVEQPFGNAVDRAGNLYLTGNTTSTEATFPDGDGFGAVPGFDRTFNGGSGSLIGGDSFVARVNPTGTGLGYATYIGGRGDERTVGIDVDDRGAAHVAGETGSRQPNFPARVGPDLSYNGGGRDAFLARLAPSGTRLDYAGYIGGSGTDIGIGIAVDAAGSAYVAGSTTSTQRSFPVRRGPDLTFNGPAGLTDAFVAKIGTATCLGRPATVVGTPGPDVLTGTDRGDVIAGLGGSDRISGGRGADVLCGGPGRDTCDGGPGRDRTSACEVRRAVP